MAVNLWLLVSFLVVLLALPVAIVIAAWAHRTSKAEFPRLPLTDNPLAEGADAEPDLPEPAPGPPASPLRRRIAGQVARPGDRHLSRQECRSASNGSAGTRRRGSAVARAPGAR